MSIFHHNSSSSDNSTPALFTYTYFTQKVLQNSNHYSDFQSIVCHHIVDISRTAETLTQQTAWRIYNIIRVTCTVYIIHIIIYRGCENGVNNRDVVQRFAYLHLRCVWFLKCVWSSSFLKEIENQYLTVVVVQLVGIRSSLYDYFIYRFFIVLDIMCMHIKSYRLFTVLFNFRFHRITTFRRIPARQQTAKRLVFNSQ